MTTFVGLLYQDLVRRAEEYRGIRSAMAAAVQDAAAARLRIHELLRQIDGEVHPGFTPRTAKKRGPDDPVAPGR